MRTSVRLLCAACCFVALTGLSYPTELVVPKVLADPAFVFEDHRDPKLFKSASESLMITNCAYGSLRVGPRDITPDPADLVRAALIDHFGARLVGRKVVLDAFSVHFNNARRLRNNTAAMFSGVIPRMMNNVERIGCAPDDNRGGYRADEIDGDASAVIVAIDLHIDEQPFRGRGIAATDLPFPAIKRVEQSHKDRWNSAVQSAATSAINRLVDAIDGSLLSQSAEMPSPPVSADPEASGKMVPINSVEPPPPVSVDSAPDKAEPAVPPVR